MKKFIKECIREAIYGDERRTDKQKHILKQNMFKQTRILQIYNELLKSVIPEKISSEYKKQLIKINNIINKNNTFDFFSEFIKSDKVDILKAAKPLDILPKLEKYNTFSIKTVFDVAEKVLQKMISQAKEKKQMLNEDSEEISTEILNKFGSKEINEEDLPFLSRDAARAEKRRMKKIKKEKGVERKKEMEKLKMKKGDLMEIITSEVEKYLSEEEEMSENFKFSVGEAVTDAKEPDTSKWLGKILKREYDQFGESNFYEVLWEKCGEEEKCIYEEWEKDLAPAQENVEEEKTPGHQLRKLYKIVDKYQQKGKIEKARQAMKKATEFRKKHGLLDIGVDE